MPQAVWHNRITYKELNTRRRSKKPQNSLDRSYTLFENSRMSIRSLRLQSLVWRISRKDGHLQLVELNKMWLLSFGTSHLNFSIYFLESYIYTCKAWFHSNKCYLKCVSIRVTCLGLCACICRYMCESLLTPKDVRYWNHDISISLQESPHHPQSVVP